MLKVNQENTVHFVVSIIVLPNPSGSYPSHPPSFLPTMVLLDGNCHSLLLVDGILLSFDRCYFGSQDVNLIAVPPGSGVTSPAQFNATEWKSYMYQMCEAPRHKMEIGPRSSLVSGKV